MSAATLNELGPAGDLILTDLVGNWFLYSMSVFVELSITLITGMLIYNTVRTLLMTRSFTRPTDPINIHKWLVLTICSTIFLRAVTDAVILSIWDEVTVGTLMTLIGIDRIFTIVAAVPFAAFAYLLFRAGPSIEFQLLRQPIPTDMHATWQMIKKPITAITIMMVLSLMVTLAKL